MFTFHVMQTKQGIELNVVDHSTRARSLLKKVSTAVILARSRFSRGFRRDKRIGARLARIYAALLTTLQQELKDDVIVITNV
jgi:hypothetical protein